jgi:hypothetical protein
VERQQHHRVLEDVEPAGPQVVCQASLQAPGGRDGVQQVISLAWSRSYDRDLQRRRCNNLQRQE